MEQDKDRLKSLRVLYVEDDEATRIQLAQFLQRRVGKLLVATDGGAGLDLFHQGHPDLVITDILMPVMDGLAMVQAIREQDKDIPIIVITAFSDDVFFLRSIELHIDRYVLKPTNPNLLQDALHRCAHTLWQRREREAMDRYTRFLLDIQPNFLMVMHHHRLEYVNQAFLNFLGFSSFDALRLTEREMGAWMSTTADVVLSRAGANGWQDNLLEMGKTSDVLFLRAPKSPQDPAKPYVVQRHSLPEQDRHIFTLVSIEHVCDEMQTLRHKAFTDPLTGTCNRHSLNGILLAEVKRAQRHGKQLSLILMDIDHFKEVNDTHGHQTGDAVLRHLVALLSPQIRAEDSLARWGGEEFMVVSPESDLEHTRLMAEKLRQLVATAAFPGVGAMTCSFGVAQYRQDDTPASLTERADQAMYLAKRLGRNRVETMD